MLNTQIKFDIIYYEYNYFKKNLIFMEWRRQISRYRNWFLNTVQKWSVEIIYPLPHLYAFISIPAKSNTLSTTVAANSSMVDGML